MSNGTATTNGTPTPPPRKLKILMLHGYTQTGPLFHAKTRALEKNLEKAFPSCPKPGCLPSHPGGIQLIYPTAPIRLSLTDIPGYDVDGAVTGRQGGDELDEVEAYAWWRRKGDGEPYRYEGLEEGFARVAEVLKQEGPVDGVIGFSQGAALAGMLAAVLEPGRREVFEKMQKDGGMRYPESFEQDTGYVTGVIHEPLKFAVSYSGFGAGDNALYRAFYEPKIATPMLHFLGSVDTVVEESRSLRLVDACVGGRDAVNGKVARVVYHPGGHFLPSSQKQYVAALVAFIRECVTEPVGKVSKEEESVEDMDMPF